MWQATYISLAGGLLFFLTPFISQPLLAVVGHSTLMQALEVDYLNAIAYSALPTAMVAAYCGYFTGLGRTQVVMWVNAVGLMVNLIFDYLLIFGKVGFPEMGIRGAGYATTIANFAAMFVAVYLVYFDKNQALYRLRSAWEWNWDLARRFLKYGLPSGLQWALEGLAFTIFLTILGRLKNGDAALAASSIAVTIMMLSVLPSMGIGQAVMVLVGQHMGEKKVDRAERVTWSGFQMAATYMCLMSLTFVLFPIFYTDLFRNDNNMTLWREVSYITPYLLMFVAGFGIFDSMNFTFSFALKGAGDTRFVSLLALTLPWPLMVLPAYFVRDWDGAIFWSWGAATVYAVVMSFILLFRFVEGKWKKMSVIHS